MIEDIIVADATVHGYNWAPSNWAIPEAASTTAAGYALHQMLSEPRLALSEEEFVRDWRAEDVSDTLFLESPTDLICHHGTPIWDFYRDGHSDTEKGYEIRSRHPDRTLVYAAINPFLGERSLDEMEYLVSEKKVNGLKVYAARYENGKTLEQRLDDPEAGYPFIQRALELGVRTIATHKAIPFGPVRSQPYGVSDVPEVLAVFPEMNFEVVHAGWAFVEDTTFLAFFPNCWFNLEICFALINQTPRRFAEFLAALLAAGAGDRIIYASGMAIGHPLSALEAFMRFEMPEDLLEGCPPLTDEVKRGILGENFLRLHDVDAERLRATIADDDIAHARADGLAEPWTHVRARLGATA
jgi:predicted TIM-barrel fold metal-dependent hydrolase